MAFVNFEKALDSVLSLAIMDGLKNSNANSECYLIGNIHKEVTTELKLLKTSDTLRALFTKFLTPGLTLEFCKPLGYWLD